MQFDLLIKGGTVIDPDAGYNGLLDVAVKRNRIAAVEANIPAEAAYKVIDARGLLVTPGLIDMHAHIQAGTFWGIDADAVGSQSGVTTWVDAGTPGALTLQGFRDSTVALAEVHVFAFVNISFIGLVGQDYELITHDYCNMELLERVIPHHRDIVAGIKVRAGRSGGGKDNEPVKRALTVAEKMDLPIMVHISTAPPQIEEVLPLLRAGDIVTHSFTGQDMRLIDAQGKLKDEARQALDRGVLLDLGHGAGSFSFDSAEALTGQGVWPYTLGSDLHWMALYGPKIVDPFKGSAFGNLSPTTATRSILINVKGDTKPVFNMLTCMDKLLFLGMSLPEVIGTVTSHPAELLRQKGTLGILKPGALADIAVFELESGDFTLIDNHGNVRHAKQHFRHVRTTLDGRIWEPIPIPAPPPWVNFVDQVS
jgi:dihydroorotase